MLSILIGAIILSINIQVGLNMHLYDVIGEALSSHRLIEGQHLVKIDNINTRNKMKNEKRNFR